MDILSSGAAPLIQPRHSQMRDADQDPIQVEGLNHWFGAGEARKQALYDNTLTIARGELVILMGPSGSGTTTLLTLIGCLRQVQEGRVRLMGQELKTASETDLVACRRRLGFIFQAHNLLESLTAVQNARLGLEVHGQATMAEWHEASTYILALLGLTDRLHYLPGNLSGGQTQRVAVTRALIGNPAIVFADEPTAALDKASGRTVVELLKRLAQIRGTTILMVTPDNRILDLADRTISMEGGRIVDDRRQ